MKPLYVVIEMADVELCGVRAFLTEDEARQLFEKVVDEGSLLVWDNLSAEIDGTVTGAGDDSHSVQIVKLKNNC